MGGFGKIGEGKYSQTQGAVGRFDAEYELAKSGAEQLQAMSTKLRQTQLTAKDIAELQEIVTKAESAVHQLRASIIE